MPVEIRHPRSAGHDVALGKNMGRIYNPDTREFLHMGGARVVPNIDHSWLGYAYQAETILVNLRIRGKELEGFVFVRRAYFDALNEERER